MTSEVFEQTLNELLEHRPFQIFTIALKSGQRLEVDSPRALAFREGRAVLQGFQGALHIFDADSTEKILIGKEHALPQS